MKNIFNKLLLLGTISFLLNACKKDEIKTLAKTGVSPTLTASQTSLVLTAATGADTSEVFSWTGTDYGYSAATKYILQIAKAGTNFATPKEINLGPGRLQKYTGADINQIALLQGIAPASAGQLEVRVKSSISDSITAVYSNKVTVSITPYLVIINYPSLWVPGDYQAWDPASAPKISSKTGNGVYEGYANITASTLQFKYTSDPDWNHIIYGWASSTVNGNVVTGTLSTASTAGNLFVPSVGYYLLQADTGPKTWKATKISTFSLIGDFNGFGADVDMTYNATTKVWTGTIAPTAAGGFKFRANHDWGLNFGDDGQDRSLDYNGANINITAGSHVITLDLHTAGNYTYSIQ